MSNLLDKASIILTPTAYNNGEALCVKPSDGSGDFDFSRNSAATRVNAQGLVENVQILSSNLVQNGDFSEEGAEQVTNGDFDTDLSGWSGQVGRGSYAWDNGKAKITNNEISSYPNLSQAIPTTAGKLYKINAKVEIGTATLTEVRAYSGGVLGSQQINTDGEIEFYVTAVGGSFTLLLYLFETGNTGNYCYFDNVSVREVGQNWTLGSGWSIGEDKAVAVSGSATKLQQTISGLSGKKCEVTFTLSNYQGTDVVLLDFGSTSGQSITANGTYTEIGTYDQNYFQLYKGANFSGNITNISVIEITDDTNLPRINYEGFSFDGSGNIVPDSGCGSWLFEPQSTNLVTYSEEITQFDQNNVTTLNNQTISADGTQNASKVTKLGVSANDRLKEDISISSATSYNVSVFLKNDTIDGTTSLGIRISGGSLFRLGFDWSGSTPSISAGYSSGTRTNEIIENYGNGWYRVGFSFVSDGTNADFELDLDRGNGGDTTSLFVWGAMLEAQSYATSYIPTSGSTVTRNQDVCNNGGSLATINSTEGTLYAEIAAFADDGDLKLFEINNGGTTDRVFIYYRSGTIRASVIVGGATQCFFNITENVTEFHKVAIKYKENDFALWIDGVEVATDTNGITSTANTLNNIDFSNSSGGIPFYGKTKALAVFPYLSDQELTELTTI